LIDVQCVLSHHRYEESIERNIELESKGDDAQRKIADIEAENRRIRERLADSQSALRKLHDMSSDSDKTDSTGRKRTRSLSPGLCLSLSQ
jgi:predicted nuclease with TOPRIM domain